MRELAPDIEPYLEEKYKEAMLKDGQIDKLVEIDVDAGLEILASKGQWSQVFETASARNSQTLHKYLTQRAVQLLKGNAPLEALQLYAKYGIPPIPQNFNLYLQLSENVLNSEVSKTRMLFLISQFLNASNLISNRHTIHTNI